MRACKIFILRVANRSLLFQAIGIQLKNSQLTMNKNDEKQSRKTNDTCLRVIVASLLCAKKSIISSQKSILRSEASSCHSAYPRTGVMLFSFTTVSRFGRSIQASSIKLISNVSLINVITAFIFKTVLVLQVCQILCMFFADCRMSILIVNPARFWMIFATMM